MDVLRKNSGTATVGDDPLQFVMSDGTRDRYGDVVEASGWDLTEFAANPIALANHDASFVAGTWHNVHVANNKLLGHLQLAPPGTSPRLDELRKLVLSGIYRACSVGFLPIDFEPLSGGGRRYKKQRLIECSIVSTPANPAALRVEAKLLGISEATIKKLIDKPPVNGSLAQRQQHAALKKPLYSSAQRAKIMAAKAALDAEQDRWLNRVSKLCERLAALRAEAAELEPLFARRTFEEADRHRKLLQQIAVLEGALAREDQRLLNL
ncbi:hypothetical protein [Bradyrhizobium sp. McL0615]|uniref:hypothetical protein n=1 Tax=Bradyrhizobium sp. McL0615 TaxID=3415673 RepID=UPI003CF79B46